MKAVSLSLGSGPRILGGALVAIVVAACGPVPAPECRPGDAAICGLERPEDIAVLDEDALLVVELRGGEPTQWFSVIDPGSLVRAVPTPRAALGHWTAGDGACRAPEVPRRPRGFDVRLIVADAPSESETDDATWSLAVVTDAASPGETGQRIEFLELARTPTGWSLAWAGCIDVPAAYFLNDVALGPGGDAFATHMFSRVVGWRAMLSRPMFALGLDTGFAVAWNARQGWHKVVGSDGSFPNGIALDPTGSVLFVAYTYNYLASVVKLDLIAGTRETIGLPLRPDNLTWAVDPETKARQLIATGATGVRLLTTSGCTTAPTPGCSFAFSVGAIDTLTLATRGLVHYDRGAVPGASVAARVGDKLFVGTAMGDRITVRTLD